MQQNAPFCVLKKKDPPPPPTAFSLSRVGMYDIHSHRLNVEWIENLEHWLQKISFANAVSTSNHADTI